jgi:hypothetical protein
MSLPDGLYDKLVTVSVARSLAGLPGSACRTLATLLPEEAPERIADALANQLTHLLDELEADTAEKASLEEQQSD